MAVYYTAKMSIAHRPEATGHYEAAQRVFNTIWPSNGRWDRITVAEESLKDVMTQLGVEFGSSLRTVSPWDRWPENIRNPFAGVTDPVIWYKGPGGLHQVASMPIWDADYNRQHTFEYRYDEENYSSFLYLCASCEECTTLP